jgi:hypothetical protein
LPIENIGKIFPQPVIANVDLLLKRPKVVNVGSGELASKKTFSW